MGFAWSEPVSSKENNRAKTNEGGGKRIIGGGVQNRFWEGVLWYVFPSPEFSTPLCFSLRSLPGPARPESRKSLQRVSRGRKGGTSQ